MDTPEIIASILDLHRKNEAWARKLEKLGVEVNNPIQNDWLLLDLALDILDVPKDNTVETNACSIANETGEWPKGAFCRDSFINIYFDNPSISAKDFMVQVREGLEGLPDE